MSKKKPVKKLKPKVTFKVQTVLLHDRENRFFIVEGTDYMEHRTDWLYTLKEVSNGEPRFKRCYQSEIENKYSEIKNPDTIKLIYGKV